MSSFVRVADDGARFVDASTGEAFVPLGCNYFDPKTGWAPKIWSQYDHDRVARQLSQIGEAGLNCVRVFLDIKTDWISSSGLGAPAISCTTAAPPAPGFESLALMGSWPQHLLAGKSA